MKHWMFKCNEVSRVISDSMDRALPLHHRMFIRIHIMMCKYCARFRRQLMTLREAARSMDLSLEQVDASITLPTKARERIKKAISTQT